jgi:hypothetical protein
MLSTVDISNLGEKESSERHIDQNSFINGFAENAPDEVEPVQAMGCEIVREVDCIFIDGIRSVA